MPGLPSVKDLSFGAVIGMVDLVDIVPFEQVRDDPFAEGPLCWITVHPRPIEPIPWPGRLMLFDVPEDLIRFLPEVRF